MGFLVAPAHRASGVAHVLLNAIAAAHAAQRGLAIERGGLEQLVPEPVVHANLAGVLFLRLQVRREPPFAQGPLLDEVIMDLARKPLLPGGARLLCGQLIFTFARAQAVLARRE